MIIKILTRGGGDIPEVCRRIHVGPTPQAAKKVAVALDFEWRSGSPSLVRSDRWFGKARLRSSPAAWKRRHTQAIWHDWLCRSSALRISNRNVARYPETGWRHRRRIHRPKLYRFPFISSITLWINSFASVKFFITIWMSMTGLPGQRWLWQ